MIVRILHEGQYKIPGADLDRINEIDDQLVECVATGNQKQFSALLPQLLAAVRAHGTPVAVDEFVESDVVLPPADSTINEMRDLFLGEGIVPG